MAQKDLAEKYLEEHADVFADIVNVLLYSGMRVVSEEQLVEAGNSSSYKVAGKIHEQTRDVQKYWKDRAKIALFGIENQSRMDYDMVLRVIGYDGAAYRNQLNEPISHGDRMGCRARRRRRKKRYPVITLVLNFDKKRWDAPKSLYDRIDIPEHLKPYVSDYRINVFDIAYLSDEQVKMFQSDFKFVAQYFTQIRKNGEYIPNKEEIRHVDAVLQMMSALTGDKRFEEAYQRSEEGENTMCEFLDKVENRGIAKGIEKGIEKGKLLNLISMVIKKFEKGKSISQIAEEVEETEDSIRVYYDLVQNNPQKSAEELLVLLSA